MAVTAAARRAREPVTEAELRAVVEAEDVLLFGDNMFVVLRG